LKGRNPLWNPALRIWWPAPWLALGMPNRPRAPRLRSILTRPKIALRRGSRGAWRAPWSLNCDRLLHRSIGVRPRE
jgi:hypothetical protein